MSVNTDAKPGHAPGPAPEAPQRGPHQRPLQGPPKMISWVAQLLAAVIMGQTLFFKFTAAPESVAIFEQLGAEPWGRIATGVLEAVAILLLLVPGTAFLGGVLTMGLMGGALGSHFFSLGIEVGGDGGALFGLATLTFLASIVVTALRVREPLARATLQALRPKREF